jgi:hypothetical protein
VAFQVLDKRTGKPIKRPVRYQGVKLALQEATYIARIARLRKVSDEDIIAFCVESFLESQPKESDSQQEAFWMDRLIRRKQR